MSCSKTTTQWRRWGSYPRPFGLESSTLPLSHCAKYRHSTYIYYIITEGLNIYSINSKDSTEPYFLRTGYVHLKFYSGTEILILLMSSYTGCHVIATPSCYVSFQRIQGRLGAFLCIKSGIYWWAGNRIHYLCKDKIENSASLLMPNGDPLTLTLMIDSYSLLKYCTFISRQMREDCLYFLFAQFMTFSF